MGEFEIIASQTPGVVRFDNYEELKRQLESYIKQTFDGVNYEEQGIAVATADRDELKQRKEVIFQSKKRIERGIFCALC